MRTAAPAHLDVQAAASTPTRPRRGLLATLRLILTTSVLRDTTVMFMLFNVGEGALLVFLPHRAIGLGLGTGGYGWLAIAAVMAIPALALANDLTRATA